MRKLFLFAVLLTFAAGSSAQNSLTFSKNSLLRGDSSYSREIEYVEPGNSGPNQIWDFSRIQFTGKDIVSRMPAAPSQELEGVGNFNILLNESGYEYYYFFTGDGFEENGYTNQEKKMTMIYSDPIRKMNYPFSFGDQFTDKYAGTALLSKISRIDVTGDYTVHADAYGTLILPDRVIRNVLRVKIINKGLQINKCGSTVVNAVRYSWYADGCRYPVMNISVMESQRGGESLCTTRTASVRLYTQGGNHAVAGSGDVDNQADDQDVSVILFPNPFNEKLTYNYFLRKPMSVTIDLYDMSGKFSVRLLKNQPQDEGLHTGDVSSVTYGMPPGVYYLRFTFDRKVIVSRVIKYN
jgi:hypothetical protein